jgi:predicted MPP superfamily phosphohydrolase
VEWHGREIALVSDLHLGNVRGRGLVRRVVARLGGLRPHAVFIAGDMFDGAQLDAGRALQPWTKLSAPAGVFFATGNHDEFTDRAAGLKVIEDTGIRVLNNERVVVQGLQVVGVHDGEAADPVIFRSILAEAGVDRSKASILLTHRPSHLPIPEEAGISLQLSGHTHRGQCWPWTWVAKRVHGPFAYGLNRHGSLQVLTSSGVGTWGPPMRVGTRAEIVMCRLEGVPLGEMLGSVA